MLSSCKKVTIHFVNNIVRLRTSQCIPAHTEVFVEEALVLVRSEQSGISQLSTTQGQLTSQYLLKHGGDTDLLKKHHMMRNLENSIKKLSKEEYDDITKLAHQHKLPLEEVLEIHVCIRDRGIHVTAPLSGRSIGYAVYLFCSSLKHSCDPNCAWFVDKNHCLVLYSLRQLEQNEGLTVTLDPGLLYQPLWERRVSSNKLIGKSCACGLCLRQQEQVLREHGLCCKSTYPTDELMMVHSRELMSDQLVKLMSYGVDNNPNYFFLRVRRLNHIIRISSTKKHISICRSKRSYALTTLWQQIISARVASKYTSKHPDAYEYLIGVIHLLTQTMLQDKPELYSVEQVQTQLNLFAETFKDTMFSTKKQSVRIGAVILQIVARCVLVLLLYEEKLDQTPDSARDDSSIKIVINLISELDLSSKLYINRLIAADYDLSKLKLTLKHLNVLA